MKELLATIALHLVIASTTHHVTMLTVAVLMIYAHLVGGVTTVALVCILVFSARLFHLFSRGLISFLILQPYNTM